MKKKTKSKIEYHFFRLFLGFNKMFPYSWVERRLINLSKFGGTFFKIRYKVALENMQKVYPQKSSAELKQTIREMYAALGRTAAETFFGDNDQLLEKCQIEGFENLEKALAGGKGAILATLHMGNWELAGISIARAHKMSVVMKKQRNKYFNTYTNKLREKENIILIDKKNALRPIIKLLRENYVVGILMDQNAGKYGIRTDFLGHPASTFVGTAKIAIKQKCPIIPAVSFRDANGNNVFVVEPAIDTTNFKNTPEQVKELTEQVSKHLEKYIHAHPADWFWVHKRWKGATKARKL